MKTIRFQKLTKYVLMTVAALMMMFSFSLYSAQAVFLTSQFVTAARGNVDIK